MTRRFGTKRDAVTCLWMAGALMLLLMTAVAHAAGADNFRAGPILDSQRNRWFVRGENFSNASGGVYEVTQMRLEKEKDIMVEAPRCYYDFKNNAAYSSGPIRVRTADGRLSLSGVGFRWVETSLFISNNVEALVYRDAPVSQTNQAAVSPSNSRTNLPIRVTSQQFEYKIEGATFIDNVRAEDAGMDLTCLVLSIQQAAESNSRKIIAETNVVLIDKLTGAQGNGDRAVYAQEKESEWIELAGNAVWTDAERHGTADRFVLDQSAKWIRAEGNARIKVASDSIGQLNAFGTEKVPAKDKKDNKSHKSERAEAKPTAPAEFVELAAEVIDLYLPLTTNAGLRGIVAERKVVIANPSEKSEATSGKAVYTNSTGIVELTIDPVWRLDQKIIRGDVLTLDTTNALFQALGSAYVRLPLTDLARTNAPATATAQTPAGGAVTNEFVDIFSDEFRYQNNLFEFRRQVRGTYLKGEQELARMSCQLLTATYSNVIQSIHAEGTVIFEQDTPLTNNGHLSRKWLTESLDVRMSKTGEVESATAMGGVAAFQTEFSPGRTNRTHVKVTGAEAHAQFVTNQISSFRANRDVVIEQEIWNLMGAEPKLEKHRIARGAAAAFSGETQRLELVGNPTAALPEGEIFEADKLIWDVRRGSVIVQGRYKTLWRKPATATGNDPKAFFRK